MLKLVGLIYWGGVWFYWRAKWEPLCTLIKNHFFLGFNMHFVTYQHNLKFYIFVLLINDNLTLKKGKGCGTRPLSSELAVLISVSSSFRQEVQWGDEGQPSFAFAHPSCLPSPYFSRYPFGAGSTLAELSELRHWPRPKPNNWVQ